MCTSGSLKGVLSGSQYNRAWRIHHALERLLVIRFKNLRNDWIRKSVNILQRTSTEANIEIGRKCSKGSERQLK